MTTPVLDKYFRSLLDIEGFASMDDSLNGLQVDNDGRKVGKVAFAVDACLETMERAIGCGAGLLFVHHGLFWGKPQAIKGGYRKRMAYLMEKGLAVYAVHLPLDQHHELGNNAALADLLGIVEMQPFGDYHGRKIGYKGALKEKLTVEAAVKRISFMGRPAPVCLPFGPRESATCAVVSGGAAFESLQAVDEGMDMYVTGESSHSVYHHALEGKLNLIAGGHYSTEVWGVRRVMAKFVEDTGLEAEFLDSPTGL